MMTIRGFLYKRKDVRIAIERAVLLNARGVYIKVTEKSLTTKASTGLVVLRTCQLVSLVVTRTGLGNHLGIK